MSAAMAMQEADVAPTARQVTACDQARSRYRDLMERWRILEARGSEVLSSASTAARPSTETGS
jgi:hypothetical protein